MTDQDVRLELDHLRLDFECGLEMQRAAACILEMRHTIMELTLELQAVKRERDELLTRRELGYELRLKQALANIRAERTEMP